MYTSKYLKHIPKHNHPESAQRLSRIINELHQSSVLTSEKCTLIEPYPSTIKNIQLVHEPDYIQLVEACCSSGGGVLDQGDTVVCPDSFEVARLAVGGALQAVDSVMTGTTTNAFALVRPPGHHAGPHYALGFCLFNNVAIAASYLLHHFNLSRILILDIDAHHGNGTQDIFYNTPHVLYISLHQDPTFFPGFGFIDEVGTEEGEGYTVNIPLPFQSDDHIYLTAFNQIVIPIIQQFKPQFILISAGFDGHYTDPVADLSLSTFSYLQIFKKALALASHYCSGKLVAILEGGYSLRILGNLTTAVIARMAGLPYRLREKRPVAALELREESEQIIAEMKRFQSMYWPLLNTT
jgi:acetoin utilization deacetylase AcuC-like enzyme